MLRLLCVVGSASLLACSKGAEQPPPSPTPTAAPRPPAAPSPTPPAPPPPGPPAAPPPPAGPPTPPLGSAFCPHDDKTKMPLQKSAFASTLDPAEARHELDGTNEICGDTWCEGSFEWFFYDLRSDSTKSEITMRVYASSRSAPAADARSVVVKGDSFEGRVLAQKTLASCTTACGGFKTPPLYKPCLVLDLRCEIAVPWSDASDAWQKAFIACGGELESKVREIHPEF